jgi:plastocyanin
MSRVSVFIGVVAAVMMGMSCGPSQSKSSGARVPAKSITGPGVVEGKVHIKDPPAPLPPLKNDPCCEGAPATVPDESMVLNDNGTLANVVVYIQGGPKADGSDLETALLDQVYCRYTPHVVGVVVGQKLNIKSSDPIVHNVHYKSTFTGDSNYWMKSAGESIDVTFKMPEFIKTGCDVHPWMNAYICVLDTPLFAITGSDGSFRIPNIPTGTYKLVAWHERFGKLESPLEIKDGTPVTTDFTFAPPAR